MIPALLRHLAHEGPRHRGELPAVEPTCTPWVASSCPVHGVCTCATWRLLGDQGCRLHGPLSAHGSDVVLP